MGMILLALGALSILGGLMGGEDIPSDAEGSDESERIIGDEQANMIAGNGGDDLILGMALGDNLDGGTGNDWIVGGEGNDTILGGDGADVLLGGLGSNIIHAGAGNDYVEAGGLAEEDAIVDAARNANSFNDIPIRFDLNDVAANPDMIDLGDGDDTLIAGSGDVATLGDGADYVEIGDWMLKDNDPDAMEIVDFNPKEDVLAIVYEEDDTETTIAVDEGDEKDVAEVFLNDTLIAKIRLQGGALQQDDLRILTY